MTGPLRAGIIGGGFMAEVHARAVRDAGREVVMIASSSPEKAADAASRLGVPNIAENAQALIASDLVDVVHVCTPNTFHAEQARLAIAQGKRVVCEKPLATSVADARELVALAAAQGTLTAVPFVYRYYPAVREILSRIARGDTGQLRLLHGNYLQDWLTPSAAHNWRADEAIGGESRTFADIGVHWCDLMEFVTGHRITRLVSLLTRAHPERSTNEDAASLIFETNRGATGTLVASQISFGRKNHLYFSFDGDLESYQWNQERPGMFSSANIGGETIVRAGSAEMASAAAQRLAYLPAGHPQGYQDAFNAFIADAYSSFEGKAVDGLPTFADGLRAALLTEAVVESSRVGEWVDVAQDGLAGGTDVPAAETAPAKH
jgi:predicted dehydrogenase